MCLHPVMRLHSIFLPIPRRANHQVRWNQVVVPRNTIIPYRTRKSSLTLVVKIPKTAGLTTLEAISLSYLSSWTDEKSRGGDTHLNTQPSIFLFFVFQYSYPLAVYLYHTFACFCSLANPCYPTLYSFPPIIFEKPFKFNWNILHFKNTILHFNQYLSPPTFLL